MSVFIPSKGHNSWEPADFWICLAVGSTFFVLDSSFQCLWQTALTRQSCVLNRCHSIVLSRRLQKPRCRLLGREPTRALLKSSKRQLAKGFLPLIQQAKTKEQNPSFHLSESFITLAGPRLVTISKQFNGRHLPCHFVFALLAPVWL